MKGYSYLASNPALLGALFGAAGRFRVGRKTPSRRYKAKGYAGTKRRRYKTYKAKGYAKTSRRRGTSTLRALKSQVKTLSKKTNESLSQLTYRSITANKLQSGVNSQAVAIEALCGVSNLEAVLAQAKFYDPSNPGVLLTANLSTGGYARKIMFKSCHARIDMRSSYQVPMEVRVYSCHVSDDTDYTASQAWTNSVGDSSNLTSITEPFTYPSDSVAKNIWNYKLIKKCELKPGQHATVSVSEKSFNYDPSVVDNHNLNYQRLYGHGRSILIVVNSVLAHDTVADQQGLGAGAIDYCVRKRFVVEYNSGGPPIKYLYYSNGMDSTFTNGAVVGNMVTDNQGFSQA